MTERVPPEEVRRLTEAADTVALFEADGSICEKDGSGHKACCPFHNDASPSLHIFPDGGWKCFGCGARGDVVEYLRRRRNLTFLEALTALGAAPQRSEPRKIDARRKYESIMPVPTNAPPLHPRPFKMKAGPIATPVAQWEYRSQVGSLLMVDVRYSYEKDGKTKKQVITWTWARDLEGVSGWHQTQPADHIPLYGLDRLAKAPADAVVLLVEGSKTADAAAKAFPAMVAMSWCGGADKTKRPFHDLTPLKGRVVILLPDADKIGAYAMAWMARHLRDQGTTVQAISLLGMGLPQGWDIADAETPDAWVPQLLKRVVDPEVVDAVLRDSIRDLPGDLDAKMMAEICGSAPTKAVKDVENVDTDEGGGSDQPPAGDSLGDRGDAEPDDVERGDIANATRFIRQHKHQVRYCPVYGRWHVWSGQVWQPGQPGKAADHIVMPLAEDTARSIATELLEASKQAFIEAKAAEKDEKEWEAKNLKSRGARLAAKAEQIQGLTKLENMLALAKTRPEICIEPTDLDSHAHLLTVENGTIDLRTGKLLAHNPDWLLTQIAPTEYDPSARSKTLEKVLKHVLGDVTEFAQLVLGRSLWGDNALEKFYVWQGPGRSGKGTLLEALKSCLGTSAMTAESKTFVTSQGRQVRDDLARLAEARVVLASEVGKGEHLDPTLIKSITGLDTIASRHLYGSYFEFRPRLTLHLQCNDLPRVDDQDDAIWNRLVVIPTGPTLSEDQRDPGVKAELFDTKRGGKALLAWLIAGSVKAAEMRYIPEPEVVKAKSTKYRADNNPVKAFITDGLRVASPENREATWCAVNDLLKAYHAHCDAAYLDKRFRMSEQRLAERIEALGCWRKKVRVFVDPADAESRPTNVWIGVTLPGAEHMAQRQPTTKCSLVIDDPEHLAAIGAVPMFLGSGTSRKSAYVRPPAHPPAGTPAPTLAHPPSDSLLNHQNSGTQEQENLDQPPGDTPGLDLTDLGGT